MIVRLYVAVIAGSLLGLVVRRGINLVVLKELPYHCYPYDHRGSLIFILIVLFGPLLIRRLAINYQARVLSLILIACFAATFVQTWDQSKLSVCAPM